MHVYVGERDRDRQTEKTRERKGERDSKDHRKEGERTRWALR